MRTVSFSNEAVREALNNDFTSIYTDTTGDPSAGHSFAHSPDELPGNCGFGAGRQNVQCIFMTPKQEIFHVAGGFRSGEDLAKEVEFAKSVYSKLQDASENEAAQVVTDCQVARMKERGFSRKEIESGSVGMMAMMPKNAGMDFAPEDLGIETGADMFDNMIDQRVMNDSQFVARNPLVSRETFEANPEALVGHGKSFFGSNSAMSGFNLRN